MASGRPPIQVLVRILHHAVIMMMEEALDFRSRRHRRRLFFVWFEVAGARTGRVRTPSDSGG